MSTAAIIVAAGKGLRAGAGTPKQFRPIGGTAMLARTAQIFCDHPEIHHVCIVYPLGQRTRCETLLSSLSKEILYAEGGDTRTASVGEGLAAIAPMAPRKVLIHDGARPFVQAGQISRCIDALDNCDAACPALPLADALKTKDGASVNRSQLLRMQTPQGFLFKKIAAAYQALPVGSTHDDDIAIAKSAGMHIVFFDGDEANFKVTTPADFDHAELFAQSHNAMISVTGQGYDVHRIQAGAAVTLCGIEVPASFSLKGHSDADVGLHAITDAVLGALAAGDIGDHFPPSDPQWKGAPSDIFLAHARDLAAQLGAQIALIDVTLICERPKIGPRRNAMRARIAEILRINKNRVSVKATTTEGLGPMGRGEGIAALASATVLRPL